MQNVTYSYKHLYLTEYKSIPNRWFYIVFINFCVDSVVAFLAMIAADDGLIGLALLILAGGCLAGWGVALLVRYLVAISISQKIVVADTLMSIESKMNNIGTDTSVVADTPDTSKLPELPEL